MFPLPNEVLLPLYFVQAVLCGYVLMRLFDRTLSNVSTPLIVFITIASVFTMLGWAWVIVWKMYDFFDWVALKLKTPENPNKIN